MPQASPEIRKQIEEWFGSIDIEGPRDFLAAAGYKLMGGFYWLPKEGLRSAEDMTEKEQVCMAFLMWEWDFGGLQICD